MKPENQQDPSDRELRQLLSQNLAPGNTELSRDLWPQMLAKLSQESTGSPWHTRVAWFDWVLAALAGAALLIFPGIIPALFYHF